MLLFAVNDNGCCVTNGKADTGSLDADGVIGAEAGAAIPVVMLPPPDGGTVGILTVGFPSGSGVHSIDSGVQWEAGNGSGDDVAAAAVSSGVPF